jgi:hypothetical protein
MPKNMRTSTFVSFLVVFLWLSGILGIWVAQRQNETEPVGWSPLYLSRVSQALTPLKTIEARAQGDETVGSTCSVTSCPRICGQTSDYTCEVTCGQCPTEVATCAATCASTCEATCESTCAATCPATCAITCPATCAATCSTCNPTCDQATCSGPTCDAATCSGAATCESTCAATCGATCSNCATTEATCENTCALTCGATCNGPTCEATCAGSTCADTCDCHTSDCTCDCDTLFCTCNCSTQDCTCIRCEEATLDETCYCNTTDCTCACNTTDCTCDCRPTESTCSAVLPTTDVTCNCKTTDSVCRRDEKNEPGLDFGDAPDNVENPDDYSTRLENDGAWHGIVEGLFLGAGVDQDEQPQPSVNADGDDTFDGNDDEDGVVFNAPLERGKIVVIEVIASGGGYLDAWVDFNSNWNWNDASEQICRNVWLVAGTNKVLINVPSTAAPGVTFARFRFSSWGGLSPYGGSPDGEVEDYRVVIH